MNTRKTLTEKQAAVLQYIADYTEEHSMAPSMIDIAKERDTNVPNIQHVIVALERKGYISREFKKSRSIKIIEEGKAYSYEEVE